MTTDDAGSSWKHSRRTCNNRPVYQVPLAYEVWSVCHACTMQRDNGFLVDGWFGVESWRFLWESETLLWNSSIAMDHWAETATHLAPSIDGEYVETLIWPGPGGQKRLSLQLRNWIQISIDKCEKAKQENVSRCSLFPWTRRLSEAQDSCQQQPLSN